ncbi:MAG: hypothetical protein ACYTEQ_17715 [Planctomycetota bacterium]|jgi:hypothetical protein
MEIEEMLEQGMTPEEIGKELLKEDDDLAGWKQYLALVLNESDGDIEYVTGPPRLPIPDIFDGLTVDDFFPN